MQSYAFFPHSAKKHTQFVNTIIYFTYFCKSFVYCMHFLRGRYIILCVVLMLGSILCQAKAAYSPKPFDKTAYNSAMKVLEKVYEIPLSKSSKSLSLADSLYNKGVADDNYKVVLVALQIRIYIYDKLGKKEPFLSSVEEMKKISMDNEDFDAYFFAFYKQSNFMMDFNSSEALYLGRQMLKEADELHYPGGMAWGYSIIGESNLYYRDDFYDASVAFKKSIEVAQKYPDCKINILRQYVQLGKSYNEDGKYSLAKKALEKADSLAKDGKDSMEILIAKVDLAYNQNVSSKEYDELYKSMLSNKYYNARIIPDTRRFYHIRWLIMMGKYNEALAQTNSLELNKDRWLMRCDVYRRTHNFDGFVVANDSLEAVRDSINHSMRELELVAMESQMNNIELKSESERQKVRMQAAIIVFILMLTLIALLFSFYINYRRKKNNLVLSAINKQLDKANKAKTVFIQNMTHELHTPLNAINGFASLVANEEMDFDKESQREMAKAICDSSLQLTRLIDDIVLLTHYDSSDEEPAKEDFDVEDVVLKAIHNVVKPDPSHVVLRHQTNLPSGFLLHSNSSMIQRLLEDLISNAVKFTKEGEIVISVDMIDDANAVEFSVTDTGCGIPSGKEEEIFNRFVKLDSFIPGTGLGLSLCRIISSKLGGSIKVDTTYTKKGTRFVFLLPL